MEKFRSYTTESQWPNQNQGENILYLLPYESFDEIRGLQFLKSEGLCEVITPSAVQSDSIQELLKEDSHQISVQTISYFMRSLGLEQNRKVELIMIFGRTFRKVFPEESFDLFLRTFNLFTELRSFSLNQDLLNDILQDYDERIVQCFNIFWAILDSMDLKDEQLAYHSLSLKAQEEDDEHILSERNLMFWGFQFLSINQINMLESLALRNDVYLPLSRFVLENIKNSDWPSWLNNAQVIKLESKKVKEKVIRMRKYSSGYLNRDLKKYFDENIGDVFLLNKKASLDQVQEIPLKGASFKVSSESLVKEVIDLKKEVQGFKGKGYQELIAYIVEGLSGNIEGQNFRRLKVNLTLNAILKELGDLTELDNNIDQFEIDYLMYMLNLNLPRNTISPMMTKESAKIFDMNSGLVIEKDRNILIASGNYTVISSHQSLDVEIEKKLLAVGPLKNRSLEELYFLDFVKMIKRSSHLDVFWERGLEDKSEAWKSLYDIFNDSSELEIENAGMKLSNVSFEKEGIVSLGSISASKLQTFYDCELKYYYRYIEKLDLEVESLTSLKPNEIGTITHQLIEEKFKFNDSLNARAVKVLNQYLVKNQKNIIPALYKSYLTEIINHARHGIDVLSNLISMKTEIALEFERPLQNRVENINVRGSVDCLITSESLNGIIDFKRSKASIPTITQVKNIEKFQLWFYNKHLDHEIDFLAYLDLSEPESSILYAREGVDFNDLKFFPGKIVVLKEWGDHEADYQNIENEQLTKLRRQQSFAPTPQNPKVCQYCFIKGICSKGDRIET